MESKSKWSDTPWLSSASAAAIAVTPIINCQKAPKLNQLTKMKKGCLLTATSCILYPILVCGVLVCSFSERECGANLQQLGMEENASSCAK